MKELLNKIKEVEEARFLIAAKTPEGLAVLRDTYFMAFGEYYQENCSPCHEKAYFKLMQIQFNPNNYLKMSTRKYLLKDGHQVQIFGSSEIYTNANLSDEKAVELLNDNPNRSVSFAIINGSDAEKWDGKKLTVLKAVKSGNTKNVAETILLIEAAQSLDELNEIIEGDDRKGIVEAVEAKKAELEKLSEEDEKTIEVIVTQEMLDENPELVKQGVKVGDTVKVTEE
jgi:hypothetical protein